MKPDLHIRLIGDNHTWHEHGAVLLVSEDEALARNNGNVVTLERARAMIAAGDAAWIGEPPAEEEPALAPAPEAELQPEPQPEPASLEPVIGEPLSIAEGDQSNG